MFFPEPNVEVEIVEVDPDAVMDLSCGSPWQSASVLRMCLQDVQDQQRGDVADYPDGITVSSNTGYPYAVTPREAASPGYYYTLADNTADADFFTSASLPPTYMVQTEYAEDAADGAGTPSGTSRQPAECLSCGRTFSSERNLARHFRQVHGPRVWHVCDVCGKPLASASSLRSHQWLHRGRKPFQCPLCSTGFIRRPYLRTHMLRVHSLHANLAVKLEELDYGECVARREVSEDRGEDEDGHLQDAHALDAHQQVVHVEHQEGLRHDGQGHVFHDQVAPVPNLEYLLYNGHRQDVHQQDVYRQDLHRQDLHRQDGLRQDLHRQDVHHQDGHHQDGHHQDGHHQDVHHQDDHHQDGHHQDRHRQDDHHQDCHHQDGHHEDVLHQVGVDSGSIVFVKSDLDADGSDSGVSSVSPSPSSGEASPASSATSEDTADAPILVRLVRDVVSGSWKIDLGQC
ncbi:transcriptional regulator ADR1-like isoform X2 [Thrips palmi]|nr:transcriptional regulator ADR1-like isoform X2 [Thrips palmi]